MFNTDSEKSSPLEIINTIVYLRVNKLHEPLREGVKQLLIISMEFSGGGVHPIPPKYLIFPPTNNTPPNCSRWPKT